MGVWRAERKIITEKWGQKETRGREEVGKHGQGRDRKSEGEGKGPRGREGQSQVAKEPRWP